MKSLKAAAVVAGTVALAGAAVPAFAQDSADPTPLGLDGVVSTLNQGPVDVMPLRHESNALDTENPGSPLSTLKGATAALNKGPLLGGLPLHG
ncbi:hypothetical protein OG739_13880 [Streptomyces longwoodensis]|uniref:hypothetical protein n=1 Tax=Streptomyces longwoodensis TaxID=68231 RepID=UPI00225BCE13|nr:hypothetical protein [Streptomyces longwoodensis]MCX4998181.1 hypothetical protein [Streptomyces longwoodensis]WRY88686.1 hypothetical protein OG481_09150 [Streptomyces longwoodensis]WTI47022.1 hypothetical protein OG547_22190 [Streptomyces longwoodensis]WUC59771.1 hypothetical protein OHA09_23135 [Streptomyces longwoodensis]WUC73299.1 hypothetical protein OG416_22130 [Streptomyces longwoodensis]